MGTTARPRPDYGLDAPGLMRAFFAVGVGAALTAAAAAWFGAWLVSAVAGLVTGYALGMGLNMLAWSRVVKVRRRERLLDLLPWRGDESVLDVGCGRGLLLVAAARRVPAGGAVGVDVWRAADQSGNRPEAAAENARREGVADRVTVETADARALPCPDAAFDVVVSHWVVHNLPTAADREQAVAEMARVLKPGGRLLLADIAGHAGYAAQLARLGLADIRVVPPGWAGRLAAVASFGSFYPATVVARKPDGGGDGGPARPIS